MTRAKVESKSIPSARRLLPSRAEPECDRSKQRQPARDIAHRVDSGDAGFEERIHRNAAVDYEAGLFCQAETRPNADPDVDWRLASARCSA